MIKNCKCKRYTRQYYLDNKEKINERNKVYAKKNRLRINAQNRARRAGIHHPYSKVEEPKFLKVTKTIYFT